MEKTSKITRTIFKNIWNNPKGGQVFYHEIELENGDKGQIGCKEQQPQKLNPGNELTYTIELDSRGNKIKAVVPNQGFSGAGGFKKATLPDPKVQMISFAMAYTKDLVVGGKVTMQDLEKEFTRIYSIMTSKI